MDLVVEGVEAGEIGFRVLKEEEVGGYSYVASEVCFPGRIGGGCWGAGRVDADSSGHEVVVDPDVAEPETAVDVEEPGWADHSCVALPAWGKLPMDCCCVMAAR